jgi:hypothetical protein
VDTLGSVTASINVSGRTLRASRCRSLATLARRLPGLRLAVSPDALRFKGESGIYGMKELPVTW